MINSPEEKIKQMEKKVNELVEESCFANDRGEYPLVSQMHFSRYLYMFSTLWIEIFRNYFLYLLLCSFIQVCHVRKH